MSVSRTGKDRLIQVLDAFQTHYRTLRDLLRQKQEALLDKDVDRVEQLVEREEPVVEQIQQLQRERKEFWDRVVGAGEQSPRDLSLPELVERVPDLSLDQLEAQRSDLKSLLRDIQRLARENSILLENRLTVYNRLFEGLGGQGDGPTYGRDRKPEDKDAKPSVIIDREI